MRGKHFSDNRRLLNVENKAFLGKFSNEIIGVCFLTGFCDINDELLLSFFL